MTNVLAAAAALLFLCLRGILLWLVIPIACCVWLVILVARLILSKPYLALGKIVGWADLNLSAVLGQVLLRPLGHRLPFTPWSQVNQVSHRVRLADPW
jgi:hypothetical protein